MPIHITVNNECLELPAQASVTTVLEQLDLVERRIAVELNGEIVPRSRYDATLLADDDQLLIVHAIGGG